MSADFSCLFTFCQSFVYFLSAVCLLFVSYLFTFSAVCLFSFGYLKIFLMARKFKWDFFLWFSNTEFSPVIKREFLMVLHYYTRRENFLATNKTSQISNVKVVCRHFENRQTLQALGFVCSRGQIERQGQILKKIFYGLWGLSVLPLLGFPLRPQPKDWKKLVQGIA